MIAAEDVKAIHSCTGSVSDFAFSFKIFAEDDISVIATTADGDETTLTITTDYTVIGENGAFGSGGTVSTVKEVDGEMGAYNYPNGYKITILLDLELKQETDLVYGGKYASSAIELMSDRLTKILQQMAEKQSRTLKLKRSSALDEPEIPDPTAGYYLYSPDGASVTWVANVTTGETAVTDFGKSLIDDENASEAQTTLGLSAFIKTLMDDANAYTARKTLLTPMSRILVAKTANYTVVAANDGALIPVDATADNIAITFPAVGDVWNGFTVGFKRIDSGANYIELTPDGSEKIDGASSYFIELENSVAWYTVDGTGWKIQTNNEVTGVMCVAAMKDPAAGTAGLRTLGTTAVKACAGNDSRLNDNRPPPDASVSQVKLKTSTGSAYVQAAGIGSSSELFALSGGSYSFSPQTYLSAQTEPGDNYYRGSRNAENPEKTNLAATLYVWLFAYCGHSGQWARAHYINRYITASGEVHWLFFLRDKITKVINSAWSAPDHPCFGNGGKPMLMPHPFGDYDESKYEIVVVNPSLVEIEQMELEAIVDDEAKPDKDILSIVAEKYEIDENSNPAWPSIPVTVGLPKHIKDKKGKKVLADYRFMGKDNTVEPIKKVIPQPGYIKVKKLKRIKQ